jgi:opine dehydrogenase
MGLVAWSSLGEFLGVPTPVTDSVVTIAAVLNAEDYWKTGRTLDKVGIKPSWSLEQLKKFMKEGSF